MSGMSVSDYDAKPRYPSGIKGNNTFGSGNFSRSSEGTSYRSGKTIGLGYTGRETQASTSSVSYSFSPAQSTTAVLGTIPSMMATSHLDNDYSLLDFILHKKSPAFKMRLSYNKQQISHYINSRFLRRKEGHKLECVKQFANLIDIAGF